MNLGTYQKLQGRIGISISVKKRAFVTAAHCGLVKNHSTGTVTNKDLEEDKANAFVFAGMYRKCPSRSCQLSRIAAMRYHPGYANFTRNRTFTST